MDRAWFDAQYADIDRDGVDGWLIGVRASQRARLNQVLRLLSNFSESYERVLDIGCGIGVFGDMLKSRFSVNIYIGSDISEKAIIYARSKEDLSSRYYRCTLPEIPQTEVKYDLVLLMEVLYYLEAEDQDLSMQNIINSTQHAGIVCITGSTANEKYFSENFFQKLNTEGLRLVSQSYHFSRYYYYFENFLMLPVRLHHLLSEPGDTRFNEKDVLKNKIKKILRLKPLRVCLGPISKLLMRLSLKLIGSDLIFYCIQSMSKWLAPKSSVSGIVRIYQKI